jgi:hypothetical protein
MNLKTHVLRLKQFLSRQKKLNEAINERFSVNPTIFLWRNRFLAMNLFTKIILILNAPPKISVGSEVDEWRKLSKSYNMISREIMVALTKGRKGIRLPEVELALDGEYSKSTIIKCAKEGVRLGLLKTDKGRYFGTSKLYNSAFERILVKIRHPDVIAFAKFVVAINEINRIVTVTADMETDTEYQGDHKTFYEEIYNGTYDADISSLPDDDDDDSSPPVTPTA